MCSKCKPTETMVEWLERTAEGKPYKAPGGPAVEWVVDGHGHLLDPSKDELDDVAKTRLARLRAEG